MDVVANKAQSRKAIVEEEQTADGERNSRKYKKDENNEHTDEVLGRVGNMVIRMITSVQDAVPLGDKIV